jgi:hypothetical protein
MTADNTALNVDQVVDVLQGVPLFQDLPRADLEGIARLAARALRSNDVRFPPREAAGGGNQSQPVALLEFSRVVQQGLLPRQVPELEHFDIAGALVHTDSSGGEATWDAFPSTGGAFLAVSDVKGSGLPAAYLLGITRSVLRQVAACQLAPEQLLPSLNHAISESVFDGLDECVQVGILSLNGNTVQCAVASEQPGMIVRQDGTVEEIAPHGPPLGILPAFTFGSTALNLARGDTVMLFSEAERGLLKGAGVLIASRKDEPVRALADHLHTALLRASGTACIAFVIARKT